MTAPFDHAAAAYDADFTHTPLARALRARVWARLDVRFAPGQSVLELGCGTGEDARRLAERGVRVVATDQSAAMLRVAAAKTAGLPVTTAHLDLKALAPSPALLAHAPYAGVFSNFGAVNALADFAPLAAWLAPLVQPGGRVILVVMGRWCAWEIGWHLLRLQPRTAFRRLRRGGAVAHVGGAPLTVHYPSTAALQARLCPALQPGQRSPPRPVPAALLPRASHPPRLVPLARLQHSRRACALALVGRPHHLRISS